MTVLTRGKRPASGPPVVARALGLLEAFDEVHVRLSLTELSRRSGTPVSSTARLASQMLAWGALERDEQGRYCVGLRLYEVGSLCPRSHDLREVALPFMGDLAEATRQHVLLAVREANVALLVERLSGHHAMPVLYRVGGRLPLHSTAVGLVLLAFAPEDVQAEVLAQRLSHEPEKVAVTPRSLRRSLADARRERAVVLRRRVPQPTMAVAVPITDAAGRVVAALSLVVPDHTTDPWRLVPALRTTAAAISRGL
jgi:DNA-binding IclR family transcriptional regulator